MEVEGQIFKPFHLYVGYFGRILAKVLKIQFYGTKDPFNRENPL
jgi:hypothetical protein